MVKKVKYVDGFVPRSNSDNRTVGASAKVKNTKNSRRIAIDDFTKPVGALNLTSDQIDKDIKKQTKKKKKAKKNKQKKKWSKKRKVITGIVIFLVLLLAGVGALLIWGQGLLNKLSNGNIGLWDVITAKDVPLKTDANGRSNVLVLGTSGYDMSGSDHDGAQLTDSIMIISLDQETKDVAILSLPRDLLVGNTCTETGKVNEIYWCNNQMEDDEEGGATAAMEQIGEILGIEFQYFAHMNWGALVQVVDSLGGVTVTLDEDIADDWTETFIDAGVPTTLNGEEALGLARARHGTASGDFSRGNSQQKILLAIRDKMTENGLSLLQVMDIMGAVGDNVRTDFNADEIKTLYNLAKDFPAENIRQISLYDAEGENNYVTTTTLANGISYVVPAAGTYDYSEIQSYIKRSLSSDELAREGADLLVLNSTGELGRASLEEDKLEEKGFNVAYIDDAPEGVCLKAACVYVLNEDMPKTAEKLKEFYGLEELEDYESIPIDYYVKPAYDFIIIVGNKQD